MASLLSHLSSISSLASGTHLHVSPLLFGLPALINPPVPAITKTCHDVAVIVLLLRKLSLSGNKLTNVHEDLGNLTNLEELYLSRNELSSLPSGFANLSKLEKLSIARNRFTIESIKQLQGLPSLKYLALNVNAFEVTVDAPLESRAEIQAYFASLPF